MKQEKQKKEEGEERKSKDKVKTAVCLLNPKILFSSHAPTSEVDIFHLDQKATKMDFSVVSFSSLKPDSD